MGEGNKFEIDNVVHGGAQQQNIGQSGGTAKMENNFGATGITFEQFVQSLKEELPREQVAQVQATVLDPLQDIAAEPEPTNEQDRTTLKARIMALVVQLEPYAPYVRKTIAAFAEGALSTLPPPAGWIVAGCIEVIRDARRD